MLSASCIYFFLGLLGLHDQSLEDPRYLLRCHLPTRGAVLGPWGQSAGPCVRAKVQDAVQSRAPIGARLCCRGPGACLPPRAAPPLTRRSTIVAPMRTLRQVADEAPSPSAPPTADLGPQHQQCLWGSAVSYLLATLCNLQGGPIDLGGARLRVTRPCERGHQGFQAGHDCHQFLVDWVLGSNDALDFLDASLWHRQCKLALGCRKLWSKAWAAEMLHVQISCKNKLLAWGREDMPRINSQRI